MALVLPTVLVLMLKYLVSSEGFLSPPLNLSVDLLDFQAYVRWLPGPGSPFGTRYYLEFIDVENFSKTNWNQSVDCSNIISTQCCQYFNHRQHHKSFFVRILAEWRGKRSEWKTMDDSFQPYSSSLSPPHLTVSADHNSISINLSHPVQSVEGVHLKFCIYLFRVNSDMTAPKLFAYNETKRYCSFNNLPQGNYCITASAFYTAMIKHNPNITKCVSVHRPGGTIWRLVVVCVSLFVLMLLGLAMIATRCYINLHVKMSYKPKVLLMVRGNGIDPTLRPEAPCVCSLLVVGNCNPGHEDMRKIAEYLGRLNIPDGSQGPGGARLADQAHEDPPLGPDLYTTALKMEGSDEYSSQEQIHGYGLTDGTLDSSGALAAGRVPGATFERTCQSAELENLLNSKLEEFEDKSKTDEQCLFSYRYEGERPSDEETGSSDSLGSCYLPRPDPRQMLDFTGH